MKIIYVPANDKDHCLILDVKPGSEVILMQSFDNGEIVEQRLKIDRVEIASGVKTPFYFDGQSVKRQHAFDTGVEIHTVQRLNVDLSQGFQYQIAKMQVVTLETSGELRETAPA